MKLKHVSIEVSPAENTSTHAGKIAQQNSFDQMSITSHQHKSSSSKTMEQTDFHNSPLLNLDNTHISICDFKYSKKLTRFCLMKREDLTALEAPEFKQLDQCLNQRMIRRSCIPPSNCNLMPLTWT